MNADRQGNTKNPWIQYWEQDEFWTSDKLWEINAEIFMRQADKLLSFCPLDTVLNIGCGPGYFENLLAPKVKEICAADTSERYLEMTRAANASHANVKTAKLKQNYTDLGGFGTFSLFLCVSVVQYYRNISEIEALIDSARSIALPGARMLIADLPQKRTFFGRAADSFFSFVSAIVRGYCPVFLRTALRFLKPNPYIAFRARHENLLFSYQQLESLIKKMELKARIVPGNLSIWTNRLNLLIFF